MKTRHSALLAERLSMTVSSLHEEGCCCLSSLSSTNVTVVVTVTNTGVSTGIAALKSLAAIFILLYGLRMSSRLFVTVCNASQQASALLSGCHNFCFCTIRNAYIRPLQVDDYLPKRLTEEQRFREFLIREYFCFCHSSPSICTSWPLVMFFDLGLLSCYL